jgi:phosphoribosyl 1,2-cyclic phosphodiesterase
MEKTKLMFLGTGGGRITTVTQARATGGWILEMDGEMIHVDPGPGALIKANEYGVDLKKLTGVLVSHCHPDHYTDAEFVVIAMTNYAKMKKGFILGSKRVMEGGNGFNPIFTEYIQENVKMHKTMKSGDSVKAGRINITATPTNHGELEGIGVVFEGSKKIGYASDGEYFSGQEDHFQNCDCLVLNCLRPRKETWPEHMNTEQAKQLIEKTKPKLVVIQHFGMKMILKGTSFKEAEWLEKETGIKTIAAKDGMRLEVE